MKRLLPILIIIVALFSVRHAHAAITFVEASSTNGGGSGRPSIGVKLANATAGNLIYVCVNHETNGSVSSVVDNQGNAYTKRGSVANGTSLFMEMWTATAGSTGALNATATYSTNLSFSDAQILQYTGFTNPTFLLTATGTANSGVASVPTTTVNNVPALIVGCVANFSNSGNNFTVGSGYQQRILANGADTWASEDAITNTLGLGWSVPQTLAFANLWVNVMGVFYDNAATSSPSTVVPVNKIIAMDW